MPVPNVDTIEDDTQYEVQLTAPVKIGDEVLVPRFRTFVSGRVLKTILDVVSDAKPV
jgi:hypothetical protein